MLILPLQHKLSWRTPPVLTLSLIIINILIFIFYQLQDDNKLEQIHQAYSESVLLHVEAPHYVDYLERNNMDFHEDYITHIKQSLDDHGASSIAYAMAIDLEFVQFLDQYKDVIWDDKDSQWWQQTRTDFYQAHIQQLSHYAYGFIPANFEVFRLFSYQFLHAGWAHLLGNMLILFILGFGLERILNPIKLLILYLLTGAFGAFAYSMVNQGSVMSLVGASGSISGLMGIFVGVYGLQKIRFFYFLGLIFGYIRLPAIVILPIWVANELMQHFTYINSQVAYFAHIGGLMSGGVLAFLFRHTWLKPKEDAIAQQEERESSFKHEYQHALELVGQLKFDQAKKKFGKLWQSHQDKLFLLDHLYHLCKIDESSKGFHSVTNLIIEHHKGHFSEEHWGQFNRYILEPENLKHIKPSNLDAIIEHALKDEQFTFIEHLLEHESKDRFQSWLSSMYTMVIDYANNNVQPAKAEHYQKCLDQLS